MTIGDEENLNKDKLEKTTPQTKMKKE